MSLPRHGRPTAYDPQVENSDKSGRPTRSPLEELREQFVSSARSRLAAAREMISAARSGDESRIAELHRHMNSLAGLGTSYGYPDISGLGLEAERLLEPLLQGGQQFDSAALDKLEQILERLDSELELDPASLELDLFSRPEPRKHRDARALIVTTDEVLGGQLQKTFESEGIRCLRAASIAEAMANIDRETPDGLITDTNLPDGTGYEIIESLRRRAEGEHAAAIVASGSSGFLDKVEAMRCGADAVFDKPVEPTAVARRLRQLIDAGEQPSRCILLVDEDPDQSAWVRALLEAAGYQVGICDAPSRFEESLGQVRPDLILMEVHLREASGYDLARWLRQNEAWATTPIVLMSTDTPLTSRIESIRAGADDHLVRPIPPALLLSAIAARIERSHFLQALLDRDGLTGLLTHSAFMERTKARFAQSRRSALLSSAIAMVDLDHFKAVNDRHGHTVGDRVLAALASLLRRRLRQSDTIGRYGGEEFAILIDDLDASEAVKLLERLLEEFRQIEFEGADGERFRVTFSAGLAMLNSSTGSLEEWINAADRALYEAKSGGRNQVKSETKR